MSIKPQISLEEIADKTDHFLTIRDNLPKIISNFKYLLPERTELDEIQLLEESTFQLLKCEGVRLIENDRQAVTLNILVPESLFQKLKPKLPEYQARLAAKANIVFKWMPGFWMADINICEGVAA